ncbi:MAG: hypothetical protein ACRC57_00625 [Sarcina sp.]
MEWFKKFFFLFDVIDDIKDLFEVIKDRNEKVLLKMIFVIMTIISVFISIKIWL